MIPLGTVAEELRPKYRFTVTIKQKHRIRRIRMQFHLKCAFERVAARSSQKKRNDNKKRNGRNDVAEEGNEHRTERRVVFHKQMHLGNYRIKIFSKTIFECPATAVRGKSGPKRLSSAELSARARRSFLCCHFVAVDRDGRRQPPLVSLAPSCFFVFYLSHAPKRHEPLKIHSQCVQFALQCYI